ncbi:MAG: glycosyltransferase family 2 protein [Proteobacteria bacterium]|nr:glycosyltransferase family 2 protein [Pseudomonadota bacterium]
MDVDVEVDVSVIIVSWNCREHMPGCIESVAEGAARVSAEVIVVDNASADGCAEFVRERFPAVRLIANDANLGFARACNQAMDIARGRHVFLLNPDARIRGDGLLDQLVAFMDCHPDVGAAGCELCFDDGRVQVSAGYRPDPFMLFAFCFFLAKLSGDRIKGLCLTPRQDRGAAAVDVDWICGAGMIVRRETWQSAGQFDERYFLYGEDIEWGCRMRDHGWRVVHLPALRIDHELGGTQKQTHAIPSRWINGLTQAYMEIAPGRSWIYFKVCLATGLALRALIYGAVALVRRDPWSRRRVAEMVAWLKYLVAYSYRPTPMPGRDPA